MPADKKVYMPVGLIISDTCILLGVEIRVNDEVVEEFIPLPCRVLTDKDRVQYRLIVNRIKENENAN